MSKTLTQIKNSLRYRIGDEGQSQPRVVPLGLVNGTNKRFRIPLRPFDESSFELYNDDALVSASGYTVDGDTGLLTYTTAPTVGTSHYCDLTYYRNSDTAISEMIHNAETKLRTVWANTYTFAGSGSSETIDVNPADGDAHVLVVATHLEIIYRQLQIESERVMRTSDASGVRDYTRRIDALQTMISNTMRELNLALVGGGYAGIETADDIEFGGWFEPALGAPPAGNVIILSGI